MACAVGGRTSTVEAVENSTGNDWPVCPSCGARRITCCPWCGTWGTAFPRGAPAPDGTSHSRRICPTCDEPFVPEFSRRCEWCGEMFEVGSAPPSRLVPNLHVRQVAVWLALAAGLGGILILLARGWF